MASNKLIDTHCHVHDRAYEWDHAAYFAQMAQNGVGQAITIGTSPDDSHQAYAFALEHDQVFWTYGYHPHEFDSQKRQDLEAELAWVRKEALAKLVGIGEIGLDYHFEPYSREQQIFLLENMLQLAQDLKLPVSFHVRDAFQDFWPIYDNFHLVPSVLHSFSDSEENLAQGLRRGLYFGVNGLSTFAKLPHAPLERVVFETDAPFLTPKPFRGKINMSGYVLNIAEWAADFYQMSLDDVSRITTQNAQTIFHL